MYLLPDERISRALNQELFLKLQTAQEKLEIGEMNWMEKRSLVKQLIRGAYLTVSVKDQSFVQTIEDIIFVLRLDFQKWNS